ncbi:MAG: carboxymethylenebutenolidase [Gammaproteobacteria bacterium]|jgi:carboxymethylenebutenolidase
MTSRRTVLKTAAALPLATVLASPMLTRAAAQSTQMTSLTLDNGKRVHGALALPSGAARGSILLVHEWWGLNAQIKSVAADFAQQGYVALAADLYDRKVADTPEQARAYMQSVDSDLATQTVAARVEWLRKHDASNGKIATIGWCFGGGWSLNASIAAPVDATVIYYGNVKKTAQQLKSLRGPVLGHFATEDKWINRGMVSAFEQAMAAAGKQYTNHWYEAQHAFGNPSSARYDEANAALAWKRTVEFLANAMG